MRKNFFIKIFPFSLKIFSCETSLSLIQKNFFKNYFLLSKNLSNRSKVMLIVLIRNPQVPLHRRGFQHLCEQMPGYWYWHQRWPIDSFWPGYKNVPVQRLTQWLWLGWGNSLCQIWQQGDTPISSWLHFSASWTGRWCSNRSRAGVWTETRSRYLPVKECDNHMHSDGHSHLLCLALPVEHFCPGVHLHSADSHVYWFDWFQHIYVVSLSG